MVYLRNFVLSVFEGQSNYTLLLLIVQVPNKSRGGASFAYSPMVVSIPPLRIRLNDFRPGTRYLFHFIPNSCEGSFPTNSIMYNTYRAYRSYQPYSLHIRSVRVLFGRRRNNVEAIWRESIFSVEPTTENLCVALLQKQLRFGAEMPD